MAPEAALSASETWWPSESLVDAIFVDSELNAAGPRHNKPAKTLCAVRKRQFIVDR